MLTPHNTYRAQHGAPALVWDATLAAAADAWAAGCAFTHATGTGQGENLGLASSGYNVNSSLTTAIDGAWIWLHNGLCEPELDMKQPQYCMSQNVTSTGATLTAVV